LDGDVALVVPFQASKGPVQALAFFFAVETPRRDQE
jgi:hypothetical protein